MFLRKIYQISGTVQGVGFRPYVYCLAKKRQIKGWVQNQSGCVILCLEGEPEKLSAFITEMCSKPPPAADIKAINVIEETAIAVIYLDDFNIRYSDNTTVARVTVPADLAICSECHKEILDPGNRRYHHPFTTCVKCGPRYTIIKQLPYDRQYTTMASFPLCPKCYDEYTNPADRRFHAETIACPECGPQLWLADANGQKLPAVNPLQTAAEAVRNGAIVAVRGIGGFQLLADAFNRNTIAELRRRKNRPDKPFALMADCLATVRRYSITSSAGETLLESPAAPAVIFPVNEENHELPVDLISPDTATLGWMLPYSPLHLLLFQHNISPVLIATSGNHGGEPIALSNQEAIDALHGITDLYLFHGREIMLRNDDSVAVVMAGQTQLWRRARGYSPQPVTVNSLAEAPPVIACGADLKNTVTMTNGEEAVVSPYIGDLENPVVFKFFEQTAANLCQFLQRQPDVVAVDLHPDMFSTRYGEKLASSLQIPLHRIQHHHAHAVSCLAEHGVNSGFALVFDGTGFGEDGSIWGAELLDADYRSFERLATFRAVPLPGGDVAVRHPLRQLTARMAVAGITREQIIQCCSEALPEQIANWLLQIEKGFNSPLSHSAGRLFDAVAALLKLAPAGITYEGQAAIRLEAAARCSRNTTQIIPDNPFNTIIVNGVMQIDWSPLFIASERLSRLEHEQSCIAAWNFHNAVANAAVVMTEYGLQHRPGGSSNTIALSGGVFQNRLLTEMLLPRLKALGLNVLIHRQLPPNDGGISFGQAVIAGNITR